ncbi:hypothetical protein QW131_34320 [Roseibium salinum]|nr:hypothetical protein [Roseibium salinum]
MLAVEKSRDGNLVAELRIAPRDAFQLVGNPENFLQDDNPAPSISHGGFNPALELMAIGRGKFRHHFSKFPDRTEVFERKAASAAFRRVYWPSGMPASW